MINSEQWGTRPRLQKASPNWKWERRKGGQEPVTWKKQTKNKCWSISFRNQACNTWIPEDRTEVSGQNLQSTQRLWLKDNPNLRMPVSTLPLQKAQPSYGGRGRHPEANDSLPEQSWDSWEQESPERRWGIWVSKWRDDWHTEQEPAKEKPMGTGH